MRKLTKVLSALIVLVLATAFIGCSNPSSSSGGGNSNSSTYTLKIGWAYLDSYPIFGFIFNDDYSVRFIEEFPIDRKIDGSKWRIVNGNTVEIYNESTGNVTTRFTANTDFSVLTRTSDGAVFSI